MAYGVITEIVGHQVKIKLNSDNMPSQIPYYVLDNYVPTISDVVLVDTKLKIVIGKVKI